MTHKTIIDRVLLFAAVVCAAGLVWQLTVLVQSKGRSGQSLTVASSAVAAPAPETVPAAASSSQAAVEVKPSDVPAAPVGAPAPQVVAELSPTQVPAQPVSAVRVVYPDSSAPKTSAKAGDVAAASAPAPETVAPNVDASSQQGPSSWQASQDGARSPAQVASLDPAIGTDSDAAAPAKPVEKPAAPAGSRNLNINTASAESLNRLPGAGRIGQAIVSHRPYKSVEELVKRRVLRRDVYERIRPQLAAE